VQPQLSRYARERACIHACVHTSDRTVLSLHAGVHTRVRAYTRACIHACVHTGVRASVKCVHACVRPCARARAVQHIPTCDVRAAVVCCGHLLLADSRAGLPIGAIQVPSVFLAKWRARMRAINPRCASKFAYMRRR
jgi:hypothetical protein